MEEHMKAEKANAIGRYNLFTTISKTIRIVELCLALFLISWILTRLPFALHISAQYFRNLFLSPLFVFALSNAIIAALLAQSSRHTSPLSAADPHPGAGIYQEFLNHRAAKPPPETDSSQPSSTAGEVPVECQDKEVISETARIDVDRSVEDSDTCTDKDMVDDDDAGVDSHSGLSGYRRSLSEKWEGDVAGKILRRELRRSETDKRREGLYPQDELSNEEFQRTIEAFIAKQMRFLKEESSAIVVQNPS